MSVTKRKIEGYGWVPDLPDPRDRIYNLEETILEIRKESDCVG